MYIECCTPGHRGASQMANERKITKKRGKNARKKKYLIYVLCTQVAVRHVTDDGNL